MQRDCRGIKYTESSVRKGLDHLNNKDDVNFIILFSSSVLQNILLKLAGKQKCNFMNISHQDHRIFLSLWKKPISTWLCQLGGIWEPPIQVFALRWRNSDLDVHVNWVT